MLLPADGLQSIDLSIQNAHGLIGWMPRQPTANVWTPAACWCYLASSTFMATPFERQVQPRPGVDFPVDVAFGRHRGTTAGQWDHHGVPWHHPVVGTGPAQRGAVAQAAGWVGCAAVDLRCSPRLHLQAGGVPASTRWIPRWPISKPDVHLVAFNDHTPAILKRTGGSSRGAKYSDVRAALANSVRWRNVPGGRPGAGAGTDRCRCARRRVWRWPADDAAIATRQEFRARGARICENSDGEEVGQFARDEGDWVVMGCPNVVRGARIWAGRRRRGWPRRGSAMCCRRIITVRRCYGRR